MKRAVYIIGAILLAPLVVIFNGYALSTMWAWFVVPEFDVPELKISEAIGISLIVGES